MVRRILLLLLAAACVTVGAAEAFADDQPYRRDIAISTRALSRELYEQTYTDRISILSEAAIGPMSQTTLPLNEHFYELVSLEAETQKADGRRIAVAPEDILVSAGQNAPQLGIFQADTRVRTIVFPSVEVGDVLTYTRKVRTTRAAVPGGFDMWFSIPPHARYGDVTIELDAPLDIGFGIDHSGFSETVRTADGRRHYRWRLPPQPYVTPEPGSLAYVDYSPYVAFSNRASDEEIGRWFYSVAADKARVTPEIEKITREVTAGIEDRREQARAIYDFASTKIRYFFVLIGQGGWIPHEADVVLRNRFGDCKDHVTLMRAMLAAKGIESEYVLLNAGSATYRRSSLPSTRYDHVILYLPEFDVYSDPTSAASAFGVLPLRIAGKPILQISAAAVSRRTAPMLQQDGESAVVRSTWKVSEAGRLSGESTWRMTGNQAMVARSQLANADMKGRGEFVAEMLRRAALRGKGSLTAPPASDHAEPFTIGIAFDVENPLLGPAAELVPLQVGPVLIELPHLAFSRYAVQRRSLDTACFPQAFDMFVDVELPDALEFGAMPLPVEVKTEIGSFASVYKVDGKRLRVERRWRLAPRAVVCSATTIRTLIMPLANTMMRDSRALLAVKRVASAPKAQSN